MKKGAFERKIFKIMFRSSRIKNHDFFQILRFIFKNISRLKLGKKIRFM